MWCLRNYLQGPLLERALATARLGAYAAALRGPHAAALLGADEAALLGACPGAHLGVSAELPAPGAVALSLEQEN